MDEDRNAAIDRLDRQLRNKAPLLGGKGQPLADMHRMGEEVGAMTNQEVDESLKGFRVHPVVGSIRGGRSMNESTNRLEHWPGRTRIIGRQNRFSGTSLAASGQKRRSCQQ